MSPTSLSQPPFETLKTSTIGAYTFLTVDQPLGSSSPMDGINRITGNEVTVLPISKSNLTPQKVIIFLFFDYLLFIIIYFILNFIDL